MTRTLAERSPRPAPPRTAPAPGIVLISPYELGRQPFALAQPAAHLRLAGIEVTCTDLSLQRLPEVELGRAGGVAIHVGMHTATRIALQALPRIRELAPGARLAAWGLYAEANAALLAEYGVEVLPGGEAEPRILAWAGGRAGGATDAAATRVEYLLPDRSGLPELARYARLVLPDGSRRVAGFAEATRGCKHLCRHCPVVPVYEGRFRAVPHEVVLADIRQQVAQGAQHISFGDPDFLNGPTHALRIVRALGEEFPGLTWDATIKVEHLLRHADLLPEFRARGCLFITSAVESVDERILHLLDKGHGAADFARVASLLRETGIGFAPTFVAFTPWTTAAGYVDLLREIAALGLVENVPPVQLSLRLLVPAGSKLLELAEVRDLLRPFDPQLLGHPWSHPDPRVDRLQKALHAFVSSPAAADMTRSGIFMQVWRMAHDAARLDAPAPPAGFAGKPIPQLSEPWYCCAEPTTEQLGRF